MTGCPTYDLRTLNGSPGGIIPGVAIEGDSELVGGCKAANKDCQRSSTTAGFDSLRCGKGGETTLNSEVEPSLPSAGSFDNPEEGPVSFGADILRESQMDSSGSEVANREDGARIDGRDNENVWI